MSLKIGDRIQGKLVEELEEDLWIVSIYGDLLQVKNTTDIAFKKNKQVSLQVVGNRPLQFAILGVAKKTFRSFNIRV